MKKGLKFVIALGSSMLCLSAANANDSTVFLGPTLRSSVTGLILDEGTAYSYAGEAGFRNFRVSATIGLRLDENQRFKMTGEYLWQRLHYNFFTGDTNRWVDQSAIGADYRYWFKDATLKPELDIRGYYSHASNKNLGLTSISSVNSVGIPVYLLNRRRLAGSDAGGAAPGVTIHPWWGSKLGLDFNWDNASFNNKFAPNHNTKGFGGTVRVGQQLIDNLFLSTSVGIRRPFNLYQASLSWTDCYFYGHWKLGLNGEYVAGKVSLPNVYNISFSIDYYIQPDYITIDRDRRDLKAERSGRKPIIDDFLPWTAEPTVHMPEVLAVTDQQVSEVPS